MDNPPEVRELRVRAALELPGQPGSQVAVVSVPRAAPTASMEGTESGRTAARDQREPLAAPVRSEATESGALLDGARPS